MIKSIDRPYQAGGNVERADDDEERRRTLPRHLLFLQGGVGLQLISFFRKESGAGDESQCPPAHKYPQWSQLVHQ